MDKSNLFAVNKKNEDGAKYPRRVVFGSFVSADTENERVKFNLVINKDKGSEPEYVNNINVRITPESRKRADLIAGLTKGQAMLVSLSVQIVNKDGKEYTNYWLDSFSLGTGMHLNLVTDDNKEKEVIVGNISKVTTEPFVYFDLAVGKGKDVAPEWINNLSFGKNAPAELLEMITNLPKGQTVVVIATPTFVEKNDKTYKNYYVDEIIVFPRKKKD